jgi:hypothetical protein
MVSAAITSAVPPRASAVTLAALIAAFAIRSRTSARVLRPKLTIAAEISAADVKRAASNDCDQ